MTASRRPQVALAVLLLVSLACGNLPVGQPTPTGGGPQVTPTGLAPTPPAGAAAPAFAVYSPLPVSLPDSFTGYGLPVDLGTVQGLASLSLSPEQQALLSENGFVVAQPSPGEYQEFYQVYEDFRYERLPLFVTTDSVLHVYHLFFDKILRDLETTYFIPTLESLTQTMIAACQEQLAQLAGTSLAETARRNLAFFAVAGQLLGLDTPTPPEVSDLVEAELALILAHSGATISPIWDRPDLPEDQRLIEDYSQYIPRGHYTRSEELERYFRTMMWYGRLTFRLRDTFETQRALLLTQALRTAVAADGTSALTLWQQIYEPTTFLVGKADDLSYFQYGPLSDAVFGANPSLEDFGDPALMAAFLEAAETLPPPQINSMWVWIWEDEEQATKGFRFMGQRFTIDAYVFEQMIWRNVGTMDDPRGLPRALDFFAALGSDEALSILDDMGETHYANFDTQMSEVRDQLGALQMDSWTQNVYWAWLYTLQSVIAVKDGRYPEFMRTQAWQRRDLNAALGSYTELKHDTILYAKQVMAEMGGGPMELPLGYVEPNPEAFSRLLALAQMTHDGLQSRQLLTDTTAGNLENLMDLLGFLTRVAESELAGQTLSEEDYWRINSIGGELEALTLAAADCDEPGPGCRDLQDQQAALVADIATGLHPDFPGLAVLEEAIGQPTRIFVVLPGSPLRISVGAVYTYYEFPYAADSRLTDEAWQALVASGETPPLPEWTGMFMAP